MKNFFILLVAVIVIVAGVSVLWYWPADQTSRQAWTAVLKNCADSDLLGKDTVYFGVSNQIGPGSIWRRATDGSLRLRYELSDIEPEPAKQAALIQLNNQVSCKGSSSSNWQIKFGLPFESAVTPVSADVESDLRRADNVMVSVNGWAVDDLKEGPYEHLIQNSAMKGEFSTSDRLVVENAYRIIGFSATFHFTKSIADQLRGKYKGSTVSTQDGASLLTRWSNDTALTIQAPGTFYLLAAFGTLSSERAPSLAPQEKLPEHVVNERQTALSDLKIGEAVVQLLSQQAPNNHPAVQVTAGVVSVEGLGNDRRLQEKLARDVGNIRGAERVEFAPQAAAGPHAAAGHQGGGRHGAGH